MSEMPPGSDEHGGSDAGDCTSPRPEPKAPATVPPAPQRLASLDAFRGLTILGMLLVNNTAVGTATLRHLTHAPWNQGAHFADMVFPWFLLIVGVAIPFAAASHRRKGLSRWLYVARAARRAVSLVLLGCLVESSLVRRPVVGLGVLQLIGLAYFAAALLCALRLPWRLLVAAVLLVAHWALIRFVPFAGHAAGTFTQTANIIAYVNEAYLRPYHLSGLLSVLPTAAMVLIGTAIGDLVRAQSVPGGRKVAMMGASGAGLLAAGTLWSLDLPLNKPVWTASYILYTAGWGCLLFGLLFWLVDLRGWRRWAFPLSVPGANAITAYVLPILVKAFILQGWTWTLPDGTQVPLQRALLLFWTSHAGAIAGGWLYTGAYIAFWWLVLLWMFRKRVLLRV